MSDSPDGEWLDAERPEESVQLVAGIVTVSSLRVTAQQSSKPVSPGRSSPTITKSGRFTLKTALACPPSSQTSTSQSFASRMPRICDSSAGSSTTSTRWTKPFVNPGRFNGSTIILSSVRDYSTRRQGSRMLCFPLNSTIRFRVPVRCFGQILKVNLAHGEFWQEPHQLDVGWSDSHPYAGASVME